MQSFSMQGHERVHYVNFLRPHQRGVQHFLLPEYSENSGKCISITLSTHPEEAMEWLKWYYQEENSWSLIEAGTWMPILDSWYTDAEKTDKWIDNPNFPDKDMYKSAVVDYAKDNMVSTSWYYVNGTDEFNATLDTVFSNVWAGQQTMQEAIDENLEELQGIYEANNQ